MLSPCPPGRLKADVKVSVLSGEGEGARGSVDAMPFVPTAGVKLLGLQEKSSRCLYSAQPKG